MSTKETFKVTDYLSPINSLRRAPLLIRAARLGLPEYKRGRDLRRVLKAQALPGPRQAIARLLERESEFEEARLAGDGRYCVARHVDVMIALMGETMLVRASAARSARKPVAVAP